MNIIDIHTHGIGGFDTRSSTAEDILRIAEIHGALGVSEIVLSIYPAPIKTMRHQMELVTQEMEAQRRPRVRGQGQGLGERDPELWHGNRGRKGIGSVSRIHSQDDPLRCATDIPTGCSDDRYARVTGPGASKCGPHLGCPPRRTVSQSRPMRCARSRALLRTGRTCLV